jgi:hypothetical protein
MKFNPSEWSGLNYLNNENVDNWVSVFKFSKISFCKILTQLNIFETLKLTFFSNLKNSSTEISST